MTRGMLTVGFLALIAALPAAAELDAPRTLAELASRSRVGPGPEVVVLVTRAPGDPRPEVRQATLNSRAALDLLKPGNDDLAISARFFRITRVDVTDADGTVIHPAMAPAIVVFDKDGRAVRTLGGAGNPPDRDAILSAMREALLPGVDLSLAIAAERELIRDHLRLSTLQVQRTTKAEMLESAAGKEADLLRKELEDLDAQIAGMASSIRDRETKFPAQG